VECLPEVKGVLGSNAVAARSQAAFKENGLVSLERGKEALLSPSTVVHHVLVSAFALSRKPKWQLELMRFRFRNMGI
jgi:hypothetical protein